MRYNSVPKEAFAALAVAHARVRLQAGAASRLADSR